MEEESDSVYSIKKLILICLILLVAFMFRDKIIDIFVCMINSIVPK